MAQNPKYDNDVVNLGYLNKRLGQTEESINKNNNSISQLPKNYSIPPNPPYYKDSLLCYKNKIYKCNTTKLSGVFSWNDWSIAATDDTTVSDFINNIYELEKLEIQEQIDGKIQTYYQETDPSNEWKTDLEKAKHIGDYWYNTTNNTQWRYNRNTDTTPITYGWGQVNVPNSVFDLIDKKKSIYTIKPTSYKKDDLWIIEDTLSNEDLPTGTEENPIAKGDWVFSVANSDTYNKEHWVKRDEDVSLSYLEQHYYTMGDIDSSFEELERSTDSKITKAKEEINLNVSQKYTTIEAHKAAINNFDEQIGTINNTIKTHETNISDLNVGVGKISASVESVKSKTEELSVDIDGVKENIIPTSKESGSNIHIEDASDKKMVNFELEGKSTQETSVRGINYCPDINEWTLTGGAYIENDYIVLPSNSANASSPFIPLDKQQYFWYAYAKVYTDAENNKLLCNTQYYDGNKKLISGNGNAALIKDISSDNNYYWAFGGDSTTTWGQTLYNAKYIRINFSYNSNYSSGPYKIKNPMITSEQQQSFIPYVPDMPSPDYPSEIESVGYENIWDEQWELGLYSISDGSKADSTTNIRSKNYIPCFPNKNYYLKANVGNRVCFYDINKNFISIEFDKQNTVFKTPSNCYYMTFNLGSAYGTTYKNDVAIFKGNKECNYIPYGKYEIEVKNTGKNLFDKNKKEKQNGASKVVLDTGVRAIVKNAGQYRYFGIKLGGSELLGKTITWSRTITPSGENIGQIALFFGNENSMPVVRITASALSGVNSTHIPNTFPNNTNYIYVLLYANSSGTGNVDDFVDYTNLMFVIGDSIGEYEPYQENKSLFVLDQPLRSLPNGTRDKVYIKNNILYVDRYVGSVVLDGSESWGIGSKTYNDLHYFSTSRITDFKKGNHGYATYNFYSNYLHYVSSSDKADLGGAYFINSLFLVFMDFTTVADFRTWLSTHNTQVDYELAEPYTEKIGEVEIPSTFKGVNNITTTDELEPVINVEYVRDTILSDYVEGQVGNAVAIQERKNAEFQITNEEIKSSVSNISTDLDGTKSSLNSVEEKITSQEKTINIISKNIDGNTGDIREVTTTTGFTFNAEGLTIDDGAGYKAQHTAQGTFYKDGDSITGQYTKDGSKQKDLELFGTYSYGKNDINDTPMFVAQLYTDENGEECFGHFYNGGDY